MINAISIALALLKTETDVVILCAGMEGKFAVEDALTAGYIIHTALGAKPRNSHRNRGSWLRLRGFVQGNQPGRSADCRAERQGV